MEKIQRLLFYSIILFLPTQLGKHFWPGFSFIEGIRIDYLSPTLYLTDVLVMLLLLTWFVNKLSNFNFKKLKNSLQITNYKLQITLLLVLVLIGSIIFSISPIAGLYKLAKILEFGFFGFYIARQVDWKKDLPIIVLMFTAGVVFESLLAIIQFLKQASAGGIFWFFGERTFSGQTPGIANASIDGRLILRPYGTFPHPNVLAGFLVIAMTVIQSGIRNQESGIRKLLLVVSLILGTIALFLTLSRVVIVLWFMIAGWLLVKKFILHKQSFFIIRSLVVLVFIVSIGSILFTPIQFRFTSLFDVDKQSFIQRQELNSIAIEMFKTSPLFGVGLNNFLARLPDFTKTKAQILWLQPAHNIFLLVAAETGIVGLGLFLWFIIKTIIRIRNQESGISSKFIILCMVLFLGIFDHYFLTLQQGQLLFAFVIGIAWVKID